ncbi:Caffeine dehydrogenase subunit gamma [Hartmannibacter diazotrophicus]|uniref:Caffeine dehydrogenase subunit gamma n=1 Tax=Hartmannibacter diazotrophicus TaxID=1482074 RepID=A0A2C9D158_9HYPH|nr:(2Fe-2S)-binding protein [Hartmannibacter diazotrophicus]SON53898.1 Caffeine dehydrogenase subunit gamma [Hartmannibacter diazotrophicus]
MTAHSVTIRVNGIAHTHEIPARTTLADFLRHTIRQTGTHVGCEHGVCGACTVLVDGVSARSCLMLAVQADGAEVETIEGLAAPDGTFHPLQKAFRDQHGLQCGFCTPGMLMTLKEVLAENPDPSEAELRDAISGNICRCTGYQSIIAAARQAAAEIREKGASR